MKHAKAVRRIIFTVLIVAAVIVGFNTYTADYYHAKDYEQRYRRRMPTSLTEIRRVRRD